MNKQVYAALSLVCGLLGFNIIAIMQSFTYMYISKLMESEPTIPHVMSIGGFYKISALVLGILAIVFCFIYAKSEENNSHLINSLGGILGVLSILLAIFPVYLWLL